MSNRRTWMKITRFVRYAEAKQRGQTPRPRNPGDEGSDPFASFGILEEHSIRELRGDLFSGAEPTGKTVQLPDVKLLAPCTPPKVVCVGRNYKSHIADRGLEPAKEPGIFWKPSSC